MFEKLEWINDYQLLVVTIACILGSLLTIKISKRKDENVWKKADLAWVVFGGTAALSAVVATVYLTRADLSQRKIDMARSVTILFLTSLDQFERRYCLTSNPAMAAFSSDLMHLCQSNSEISSSIAANDRLPLFQGIQDFSIESNVSAGGWMTLKYAVGSSSTNFQIFIMEDTNPDFSKILKNIQQDGMQDLTEVGIIDPLSKSQQEAIRRLRNSGIFSDLIADYTTNATFYNSITKKLVDLNFEWAAIQDLRGFLLLRSLALILVAFAFPFRIGKSIYDIKRNSPSRGAADNRRQE